MKKKSLRDILEHGQWDCGSITIDQAEAEILDWVEANHKTEKPEKPLDYTEIRDNRIRGVICKLMSEMLDNPDKCGIYPTSKFMWEMETFILNEFKDIKPNETCSQKARSKNPPKIERLLDNLPKPPMVDGQDEFQRGKLLGWIEALAKVRTCLEMWAKTKEEKMDKKAKKKDSFEWMKEWLDAYDKKHEIKVSEAIMDWILKQEMGC